MKLGAPREYGGNIAIFDVGTTHRWLPSTITPKALRWTSESNIYCSEQRAWTYFFAEWHPTHGCGLSQGAATSLHFDLVVGDRHTRILASNMQDVKDKEREMGLPIEPRSRPKATAAVV